MYNNLTQKIHNLLSGSSDDTFIQLFRYCWVGGAAFIVDYGLLYLLTSVYGFHYLVSAIISFVSGLITNYALSTLWVFNKHKVQNQWVELAIFSIIGIIGLIFNEAIMYFMTENLGTHYMISKITSTIIVFFWNFFARKIILFNK